MKRLFTLIIFMIFNIVVMYSQNTNMFFKNIGNTYIANVNDNLLSFKLKDSIVSEDYIYKFNLPIDNEAFAYALKTNKSINYWWNSQSNITKQEISHSNNNVKTNNAKTLYKAFYAYVKTVWVNNIKYNVYDCEISLYPYTDNIKVIAYIAL